jgi:hypothetical protein
MLLIMKEEVLNSNNKILSTSILFNAEVVGKRLELISLLCDSQTKTNSLKCYFLDI